MKNFLRVISILSFVIFVCISISEAKSKGGYINYKSSGGYKVKFYAPKGYSPSKSYKSYAPKNYAPEAKLNISSQTGTKIKGYYRKDGTYVRSHYKSSPDSDKSNNFGRPSSEQIKEYKLDPTLSTYKYDYEKDGMKNSRDKDDDNDFVTDNNDSAQYNSNKY